MLYYLANILWDSEDISERRPLDFKAATYRVKHISSAYNNALIVVSEGEGKATGKFNACEKRISEKIKICYLKYINDSKLKRLFSICILTNYLYKNVKSGDCILTYNAAPVQSISLALFRLSFRKVKITIEFEEFHRVENNNPRNFLMSIGEGIGIVIADRFIVANTNMTRKIKKIKFFKKQDCLLSCGYLNAEKHKDMDRIEKIRESKPCIVYSGRMDYVGGFDIFVEALKIINLDCEIIITGKCPFDIKEKLSGINSQMNIQLVGYLNDLKYLELLNRNCICINPLRESSMFSRYSFPSKILQYLQTGNIVISSNISSLQNLQNLKKYIYIYNQDNPQNMKEQLVKAFVEIDKIDKNKIIKEARLFFQADKQKLYTFLNIPLERV